MSYPYCYKGRWRHLDLFCSKLTMKKLRKNWRIGDQLQLLAAILARWHDQWLQLKPWTTSIGQCMRYCTGTSARLSKRLEIMVHFFIVFFVCCHPGGRWGNTTWILTRWQHPVASGLAMDPLHRAMCAVLYRRISLALKTGCIGGAFDRHQQFRNRHNHS